MKHLLAINKIEKVGPVTIKKLWEHFGSIENAWEANAENILQVEGINKNAAEAFIQNRNKIDLNQELEAIRKSDIKVLTLEDKNYPTTLKNIYAPPPVLYLKGSLQKQDEKAIAIVGTRRASRYGKEIAKKLAYELSSMGFTIVSGMAAGIDTVAHQGALEAGGRTLAIFGTGVDVIYPRSNKELSEQISSSGALISEFPIGADPDKGSFPRRNRVISGLSMGTIVIEGDYTSGAMITAKCALDQGREVFAVPGNVEIDQSKGPHWLIKNGAKLVETVDDVLEELNMVRPVMTNDKLKMTNECRNYSELSDEQKKIVEVLSLEPKHIDRIVIETSLAISQVSSLLMMLEVKKIIRQLPGKMFILY
ncbi:MAG: DNA-processing protein DprA [Candidatus Margulisiibacteriota bacterium]|nr:DNA-processing protein DprA [Candidatus Margulisiibacteriota bacterium]